MKKILHMIEKQPQLKKITFNRTIVIQKNLRCLRSLATSCLVYNGGGYAKIQNKYSKQGKFSDTTEHIL